MAIGAHVDSAFKEMARFESFSEKEGCREILRRTNDREGILKSSVRAFDEIYGISSQEITFKCLPKRRQIIPFKEVIPEWWHFYNDVKHDISANLSKATLNAVRDALAGAFLLNVVHEPSALRLFDYGLLKPKYLPAVMFEEKYDKFRGIDQHLERPSYEPIEDAFIIETSIFLFDYEKMKNLIY